MSAVVGEATTASVPESETASAARGWHVYLLECVDGSLYTGIAIDVALRFRAHQSGRGARYTRSHPPRRVMAAFACADRSHATRLEHAIKQLGAAHKRLLCDPRTVQPAIDATDATLKALLSASAYRNAAAFGL